MVFYGNYADICSLNVDDTGKDVIYDKLIAENCAPLEASSIGVYNSLNEKVDTIDLGTLNISDGKEKQYSFAAISDTHIGAKTSEEDLKKALQYFANDEDVKFINICGDLTVEGTKENLNKYKLITSNNNIKPIYAIAGNHEARGELAPLSIDGLKDYTGQDLYYSFTKDNDVYIMMGMCSTREGNIFLDGELQWLYETLEKNRNKRCFLFMHLYPRNGSGDAIDYDLEGDMLSNTQGEVFYSLLSHYSNVIYFHGHSHEKFKLQEKNKMNNYDNIFGCHSVHIPSLAYTRDISGTELTNDYESSEGYVVDVYDNKIILRGRDFKTEKFLPIAYYKLDTTIKNVEANTYHDPTGTITNV